MKISKTNSRFSSLASKATGSWFAGIILSLGCAIATFTPAAARLGQYLAGNAADVNPPLSGPVYNLGGGGRDVDPAIQWMINQVRGCTNCDTKIDVVVVRSPDEDPGNDNAYNQPILNMQGVDSVETLVIGNREEANQTGITQRIQQAEVIFFAGGNQCSYARNFQRTRLEDALKAVYARGGGIGGTSAGAMIQSDFVYNACLQGEENIASEEALRDPYANISFTHDLFPSKILHHTIVDTHFDVDDRMGRLMAFVARQIRDGLTDEALGIGIPEATSFIIDQNGMGRVMGKGPVYLILGDHQPEYCEPGRSLSFTNFKIWRVDSGQTLDLRHRPTTGFYLRTVDRGEIRGNPYRAN